MHFFNPFPGITGCFMGRGQGHLKSQGWGIEDLFLLKQVHGDSVVELREDLDFKKYHHSEGDGILCTRPGRPIAIKTADCVPILFAHPSGLIGAVHAGWKGSSQEILLKILKKISKDLKIRLEEIKLAIGPAICWEHYEVGGEVAQHFSDSIYSHVTKPQGSKFLLNLQAVNKMQALSAGVRVENIQSIFACTFEDPNFQSYRRNLREGKVSSGRNYSWIVRES
jgi:YfiH family protein